MGSAAAAAEKTEEELRKELDQLNRQHREINERLRNPRGIRRGAFPGPGPRNFAVNGGRGGGFVRPAERDLEGQPPAKRRLSSTIVKAEDGEIIEDEAYAGKKESTAEYAGSGEVAGKQEEIKQSNWSKRGGDQRLSRMDFELPPMEHVPRVLPKNEEPSLVNRNRRMFGQLLGTLEKFRKEDKQLSETEAYMRRHNSLQLAEQKAREESEKLRQQEREQIAVKRKRDLTLRARVAAKAEEKRMELLFLQWSEHQRKLGNFLRTKAKPPIFYMFAKPMDKDAELVQQRKEQTFEAWKAVRREDLSRYQKQVEEQYIANVEKDMEKWQNARRARKTNNDMLNLQETMDKELETHRLEHGPKTRKIPGGANNEDEDDVEDINAGEDDMLDDVLDVDENNRRVDETVKLEAGNGSPHVGNGISSVLSA